MVNRTHFSVCHTVSSQWHFTTCSRQHYPRIMISGITNWKYTTLCKPILKNCWLVFFVIWVKDVDLVLFVFGENVSAINTTYNDDMFLFCSSRIFKPLIASFAFCFHHTQLNSLYSGSSSVVVVFIYFSSFYLGLENLSRTGVCMCVCVY